MRTSDSRFTTPLEQGFEKVMTPFQEFAQSQTTSSIVLMACAGSALVLANSGWRLEYESLVNIHLGIHIGEWSFDKTLRHWINDALMALFFFVIGLEIKRELLVGELREPRRAMLLIAGAVGGMVAPAVIYHIINPVDIAARGWGIPTATDTAFALGILALLGRRVPEGLMTFLAALAIIDDIGAVLIIAAFYTEQILLAHLGIATTLLVVLLLLNVLGVRRPLPYFLIGALVWLAMLESGVHATIAGILVAFTIPARPKMGPSRFLAQARNLVERFEAKHQEQPDKHILEDEEQHAIAQKLRDTAKLATTPLQRWEHALEVPVALLVLPIFALANAGIPITSAEFEFENVLTHPVTLGIVFALVIGKFVGITGMCWVALKTGIGRLPGDVKMPHIAGVGLVAGMGFTMSMFIATLAFDQLHETLLMAKSGILLGSLIAGSTGFAWLWLAWHKNSSGRPAESQQTL